MARKTTGGKRGRPAQSPARDHFVFHVVEWVMLVTGRPLGSGAAPMPDEAEVASGASACTIAAWMLSGGRAYGEHLTHQERHAWGWRWVDHQSSVIEMMEALGVPTSVNFNLSPSAVRDAYQRVKALPHYRTVPAIREWLKPPAS